MDDFKAAEKRNDTFAAVSRELSSPDAFRRQTGGYHEDAASDDPEISLGSSRITLVILFGYCHAPRIFLLIKQMRH
ncbi:hypothetical protein NC653_020461 [Populus alba x Populus x berolinensis]|uniref:Uncharacterized protein n=1 Tax=Populus alba x Populus x berolinensis TaxID=444605 RepID=A0AAD6MKF4_9ROSI|nr:hypothetical protein NC653_020454 [Populus alba x Populus x berolinensis]KAJ6987229.1 hypothetical protein NC653_020461 [Populus alba x Populus x berolinensis]